MTAKSALHPLAAYRKRLKISQTEFARRIGQFQQNLQRYERGRMPPKAVRLAIEEATDGELPASADFWEAASERARSQQAAA